MTDEAPEQPQRDRRGGGRGRGRVRPWRSTRSRSGSVLHPRDLRVPLRSMRRSSRWLRGHAGVRRLSRWSSVRCRWRSPVRDRRACLRPEDVRSGREELRPDPRRLRWHSRLRCLPGGPDLQRWWSRERLWAAALPAHDVRSRPRGVRTDRRRLRRGARMRSLPRERDVRRGRGRERLRRASSASMPAHDVRGRGRDVRVDPRWLRPHAQLRRVPDRPDVRRGRGRERLRRASASSAVPADDLRGRGCDLRVDPEWLRRDAPVRHLPREPDVRADQRVWPLLTHRRACGGRAAAIPRRTSSARSRGCPRV
jgi:hypothetical protein